MALTPLRTIQRMHQSILSDQLAPDAKLAQGLAPPLDKLVIRVDPSWPHMVAWRMVVNPEGVAGVPDTHLAFAFVDLEEGLTESAAVNYADTEIVGRAEAYKTFISTGNKQFPINFQFRAQGLSTSGEELTGILQKEVVLPARWLDALKYPVVWQGLTLAPPPCILQVGSLFVARVVADDVQIQWQHPFDPESLLPHGAEVSCTFSVVRRVVGNYPMDGLWGARRVTGAT